MQDSIQLSPFMYSQQDIRMEAHSESQRQLREAGCHLPAFVPHSFVDAAILLYPCVVEL